ncbi:DUF6390 family protein [Mycobacterium sp. NPDC051804]|uniref:DUF6390 family protein n=1 Tax=Mycobacterium sp. NPDC051804 TaxID=3364295 RepID=UPI0037A223B4
MSGHETFACYAFPPNELGYCGPADVAHTELASHAREFDGAWPYLQIIADAAGVSDPLDEDVVRNYWVGGPLLEKVDPTELLSRLRRAFTGQVTGLLGDLTGSAHPLAHHSFHVFVVYPWIRFLDRDPTTPLRVMQDCRIRWGTVSSVTGDHAEIVSRPLSLDAGVLVLGGPRAETVRWAKNGQSLASPPRVGETVSAHWDWVCGSLSDAESSALAEATQATLDLVNAVRSRD